MDFAEDKILESKAEEWKFQINKGLLEGKV